MMLRPLFAAPRPPFVALAQVGASVLNPGTSTLHFGNLGEIRRKMVLYENCGGRGCAAATLERARRPFVAKVNPNYQKLPGSYLFSEIARRTAAYSEAHPEAKLIKMGIGDVTYPLVPAVIEAMHAAVEDMAKSETFHGYGPEQGYDFLRAAAIVKRDFHALGVDIADDEIFISDGAKSDLRQHRRHPGR